MKILLHILPYLLVPILFAQTTLIEETFTYPDGPLSGKGEWSRGVTSPSADNPSDYLQVADGKLAYNWTTADSINNALRWQWEEALYEGWVYAQFSLQFSQAPANDNTDTRPTLIHFDRSGGSQMRGHIGVREGPEPGTAQLGISPSSQQGDSFVFAEDVLLVNVPYTVRIGYDIGSSETWLWIDPTGENPSPAVTATGSPGTNVRRIQLKLRNSDGSADGVSNMGVFTMDDLLVYTDAPPGTTNTPSEPIEIYSTDTFADPDQSNLADSDRWIAAQGSPSALILENKAYPFHSSENNGRLSRLLEGNPSGTVAYALTIKTPIVSDSIPATNIASLGQSNGLREGAVLAIRFESGQWQLGLRDTPESPITWSDAPVPDAMTARWIVSADPATGEVALFDDTDNLIVDPIATLTGTPFSIQAINLYTASSNLLEDLELSNLHVTSTRASALAMPVDIVPPPPTVDKFLLFLLAGQSNMAGRGDVESQDLIGNRRILTYNEERKWEVARDPLHWDRPGYNGVGPALSFARELLKDLPEDVTIGLIPTAQGGTSISWWQKNYSGSNLYYGGQRLFDHAVARATEAKSVGQLTAILWNQGENDAGSAEGDNGAAYRSLLHALINDFRTDLNLPDLPFIGATLGPWRTNANALNAVYLELPSQIENTAVVNTGDPTVINDLVNNPSDTPHYMNYSYRLLGALYANAFAPFLPQSEDPLPWGNALQAGQTASTPWFGEFTKSTEGWINHNTLSWINMNATTEIQNLWMFSLIRQNWIWSSDIFFPILYDFKSNDWIYFAHYEDYGTHIYSYSTDSWIWELVGD